MRLWDFGSSTSQSQTPGGAEPRKSRSVCTHKYFSLASSWSWLAGWAGRGPGRARGSAATITITGVSILAPPPGHLGWWQTLYQNSLNMGDINNQILGFPQQYFGIFIPIMFSFYSILVQTVAPEGSSAKEDNNNLLCHVLWINKL